MHMPIYICKPAEIRFDRFISHNIMFHRKKVRVHEQSLQGSRRRYL